MDYVYTVRVRFSAFDDVAARQKINEMTKNPVGCEAKDVEVERSLQEVFVNKVPRKMILPQ